MKCDVNQRIKAVALILSPYIKPSYYSVNPELPDGTKHTK